MSLHLTPMGACSWAPYLPIEASLLQRLTPPVMRGQVFGARLALTTVYESIHRTSSTVCLLAESDEQARALLPASRKARLENAGQTALIGSPETIRKRLVAYEAARVQELVLRFVDGANLEALRRFAEEFIA